VALREANIKEIPYLKGQKPWNMLLQRNMTTDELLISINGAKGALKARFRVGFSELKQAIKELEN